MVCSSKLMKRYLIDYTCGHSEWFEMAFDGNDAQTYANRRMRRRCESCRASFESLSSEQRIISAALECKSFGCIPLKGTSQEVSNANVRRVKAMLGFELIPEPPYEEVDQTSSPQRPVPKIVEDWAKQIVQAGWWLQQKGDLNERNWPAHLSLSWAVENSYKITAGP